MDRMDQQANYQDDDGEFNDFEIQVASKKTVADGRQRG